MDAGEGVAQELAGYLSGIGCSDVSVLEGGVKAWRDAGYVLFPGVSVAARAFAAWVMQHFGTESIDAAALKSWPGDSPKPVLLDCRPAQEFARASIAGSVRVPLGEIVYRIADLAPDPGTPILVIGADGPASILGAESLRRIGIRNRVLALRHGMLGWSAAQFRTERGRTDHADRDLPADLSSLARGAGSFAEACGVGVIGAIDLVRFEEDPDRTCYVLDVRESPEFRAGHRPGSFNAPAGELLLATHRWVGVGGARIVLLDDMGVRARMAGGWLRLMGWRDVFVVEGGLEGVRTSGTAPVLVPELAAKTPSIDVPGLTALLTPAISP